MPKVYKEAKTGEWAINTFIKRPDGGFIHFHKRGYKTKGEAERDVFRQSELILLRSGERTTSDEDFSTLIDGYRSWKPSRIRYHTMDNQNQVIRQYIEPRFAHKRITDVIDPKKLSDWRGGITSLSFTAERKDFIIRIMRDIVAFGFDTGKAAAAAFRKSKTALEPFTNDSGDVKRGAR